MSEITVKYRDEIITYDEANNAWRWSGSHSAYVGLSNARASIDRAIDGAPEKKKKFPHQKAIYWEGQYHKPVAATVTSEADGDRFWVKMPDKWKSEKRSQAYASYLFADTPANHEAVKAYYDLEAEIDKIREQQDATKARMQRFADWLKNQSE